MSPSPSDPNRSGQASFGVQIDGRGRELPVDTGLTLAQSLFVAGIWRDVPLCSGLGRCGRCRVRWLSAAPAPTPVEARVLGAERLADGWRLACRHTAMSGDRIEVPPSADSRRIETVQPHVSLELALAVDLGTTSLCWEARSEGTRVAAGSELNPQLGAGAEVMSRMAFAEAGHAGLLKSLVLERLKDIAESLPSRPVAMCVAANPAMTYLLLGLSTGHLSRAPYGLDFRGGSWQFLDPRLPSCYVPPLLGPFVGADVSAGLAALLANEDPVKFPFLLVDLGTNGEFVLGIDERSFLAASVPLGPALEGIGLSFGAVASPGAARSFACTPAGLAADVLDSGGRSLPGLPKAITGVGYISLLATLLRLGVMDALGRFTDKAESPLAARVLSEIFVEGGEARLALPGGLWLAAGDVEELLKVKAAFNVAISRLLREAGLCARDLSSFCLAGAMGVHVDPADLERLGFLPPGAAGRARVVGNTSLAGASLLLENERARSDLEALAETTRVLDLTADSGLEREFLERMVLTYVS